MWSSVSILKASLSVLVGAGLLVGCASEGTIPTFLSEEDMMSPETCQGCHSAHYEEWAGSMHAYASLDPVFLAMNRRGQEETGGELGDFCVQCHAPMAVALGLTTDGLNLEELPSHVQGVTCYFCHSVESVQALHNNSMTLSSDLVMRGGLRDPVPNSAHASAYSPLHDREDIRSSDLCGSCHDVVTPAGIHLERTYAEWQESLFSHDESGAEQTCGNCHMAGRDEPAAQLANAPIRRRHNHRMVGVDVALTPFPDAATQRAEIQEDLNTTVVAELCIASLGDESRATVTLENIGAGHSFPSGAAHDRRAWVELIAYDEAGEEIYASGAVGDGEPVAEHDDPDLWQLRDFAKKADGSDAHFFWEVASVQSELLPAPTAFSILDPDYRDPHRVKVYTIPSASLSRVTLRVRLRPMGLELLESLVESGHLAPEMVSKMPTFDLGSTKIEWSSDLGVTCVPDNG